MPVLTEQKTDSVLPRMCHRRLDTGLSLQILGFNPRKLCVRFMVDEVALKQNFSELLLFTPIITIPPLLHTQLSYLLRCATVLTRPYASTSSFIFVSRLSPLTQHLASYNRIQKIHFNSSVQHNWQFYSYKNNSGSLQNNNYNNC